MVVRTRDSQGKWSCSIPTSGCFFLSFLKYFWLKLELTGRLKESKWSKMPKWPSLGPDSSKQSPISVTRWIIYFFNFPNQPLQLLAIDNDKLEQAWNHLHKQSFRSISPHPQRFIPSQSTRLFILAKKTFCRGPCTGSLFTSIDSFSTRKHV